SLKYSSYILQLKILKATLFKNNEYLKKLDEINNEFI
ncbi:metal ABC transporter ATP-binding protein, partial [Clostridium perfringens]